MTLLGHSLDEGQSRLKIRRGGGKLSGRAGEPWVQASQLWCGTCGTLLGDTAIVRWRVRSSPTASSVQPATVVAQNPNSAPQTAFLKGEVVIRKRRFSVTPTAAPFPPQAVGLFSNGFVLLGRFIRGERGGRAALW